MTKKIEVPEFVVKEFGKTLEDIHKNKSVGNQTRGFSQSSTPETIKMDMGECKTLCAKAGVKYKEGFEKRILSYVCSSDRPDRMGDVIKQDGWDLTDYNKNPVVMGFHDYSTYPVGNSLKTFVEDGKLKMWILFADKETNEAADTAFKMCESGFMKASSVGFAPIESKIPSKEEREALGMPAHGMLFNKQSLLEHSVCGVPANADALQESINKGLFKRKELKGWLDSDVFEKLVEIPETKETKETDLTDLFSKDDIQKIKTLLVDIDKTETKSGAEFSKKNINTLISIKDAAEGVALMIGDFLKQAKKETEQDVQPKSAPAVDELIEINLDELENDDELDSDLHGEQGTFEFNLNEGDK